MHNVQIVLGVLTLLGVAYTIGLVRALRTSLPTNGRKSKGK